MAYSPYNSILTKTAPTFGLSLSDDALVTIGTPNAQGVAPFTDQGFMDVNALTIGGLNLDVSGLPGGLYIHYNATGIQHFANGALTTADFQTLQFGIFGYTGHAVFGHDASGTPTVSGVSNVIQLAQGNDLIAGQLTFGAAGISGELDASLKLGGAVIGTLELTIHHGLSDITPTVGGFKLDGGSLQATFVPASHS